MNRNRYKAMVATLLSVFHLTIPEIGRLTDRMIHELYFHPRAEDGSIKAQEDEPQPGTLEYELVQARRVARKLDLDPAEIEQEARDEWNKKHKSTKRS